MNADPQPIRKSSLPTTRPPEWEFHTWFPHPDGGGDMVPGERQRGVLVRRRVSYGDWEPVRPDHWADEPESAAPAAAGVVSAAPDRADALVADARRAVHEALVVLPAPEADRVRALIADLETAVEGRTAIRMSDAAAPPADRAAVLREVAAAIEAPYPVENSFDRGRAWVIAELRRVAVEARQQPDTETRDALMRAHVALAEQAGQDQATLARVRTIAERAAYNVQRPAARLARRILAELPAQAPCPSQCPCRPAAVAQSGKEA